MFAVSFGLITLLQRSIKTAALTFVLLLIMFGVYSSYKVHIAAPKHVDRAQSAASRITTWEQGWSMFSKTPLLGVGFNAYRPALAQYNLASPDQIKSRGASSNDSSVLFVACTTGVIGLSVYVLFFGEILRRGWQLYQRKNTMGVIMIATITGFLSQSFFANLLFYPFILFWLFIISALGWREIRLKAVDK